MIGDIGEAVVTVPANFPNKARVETTKAAKMAKLNAKLIDEPTAAALYYAFKGGVTLNGRQILEDASQFKKDLETTVRETYEIPPLDLIG